MPLHPLISCTLSHDLPDFSPNHYPPHCLQHFHDLRLVWPPQVSGITATLDVILIAWGIAFFEYCFQVPANRMGFSCPRWLPTQNPSGDHHAHRLRHLRQDRPRRGPQVELYGEFRFSRLCGMVRFCLQIILSPENR